MQAPIDPPTAARARPASAALIVNSRSGSYDPAAERALVDAFTASGLPIARLVRLPDDPLPDAATLDGWGVDTLAIWTGDGTISAAADTVGDWSGALLVLPGGTLNLLSKALHGDRDAAAIIADVADGRAVAAPIPAIEGEGAAAGQRALVSAIVGPTTAWGEVRAALRDRDLGAMVATAREAVAATLSDPDVRVDGIEAPFQAVNLSPGADGIAAIGFVADGATDLLRHGAAWMGGDFRDGPHEPLGDHDALSITGATSLGLQIDGELIDWSTGADAPTRLSFRAATTRARFWRTLLEPDAADGEGPA